MATLVIKLKQNKITIILDCIKKIENWWIPILQYFNIIHDKQLIQFRDGLKCYIRDKADAIAFFEIFFLHTNNPSNLFSIKKDDIVLDIGAHVGYFTLYASKYAARGKILAYEPNKSSFLLLEEHIKLNKIKNVIPVNYGVLSQSGTAELFLEKNSSIGNSIFLTDSDDKEIIHVTSIPEVMKKYDIKIINFLKLDCEGAEFDILSNLQKDSFDRIQKISSEMHPSLVSKNVNEITKLLSRNKFLVKTLLINKKENLHMLYAIHNS